MPGEMKMAPEAHEARVSETITEIDEDAAVLELEIVDVESEPPIFQAVDDEVEIAHASDKQLIALKRDLEQVGLPAKKSHAFIKSLAKSFGGRFADVLGFRPVPPDENNTDLWFIDLLFGRVHMPAVEGFTTKLGIENERDQKEDIRIKVFGIGAGGSKTFICKASQSQTISAIPIDLVIPATVRITRFENASGDFFYLCYPLNVSRKVVPRHTMNPYDSDGGYEKLIKLQGTVDRYDTRILKEPELTSETLKRSTKINLTADIGKVLKLPNAVKLSGVATVMSILEVSYTIPVGYQFASYVQNQLDFNHIWARK